MRTRNVKIQNKQVLQVLEENTNDSFYNLCVGKCFLNVTQNPNAKEKIDKFYYITLKKNYMAKNKQNQKKNI